MFHISLPPHSCTCPLALLQLTGGNGFNGYLGLFGTDTISLPGALNATLDWTGLFACYENTFSCNETDTACVAKYTSCPAPSMMSSGQCPNGTGLEAGERVVGDVITVLMSSS